jgi:hypothetical protein
VFCRVKPTSIDKKTIGFPDHQGTVLKSVEIKKDNKKFLYYFDRVFDESCSQENVKLVNRGITFRYLMR